MGVCDGWGGGVWCVQILNALVADGAKVGAILHQGMNVFVTLPHSLTPNQTVAVDSTIQGNSQTVINDTHSHKQTDRQTGGWGWMEGWMNPSGHVIGVWWCVQFSIQLAFKHDLVLRGDLDQEAIQYMNVALKKALGQLHLEFIGRHGFLTSMCSERAPEQLSTLVKKVKYGPNNSKEMLLLPGDPHTHTHTHR